MAKVSIAVYCKKYNLTEDEVRAKIKRNELVGRPQMGIWYVHVDDSTDFDISDIHKTPDTGKSKTQTPKQLIKLSTLDYLSGEVIEELGLIASSSVQGVNVFKNIGSEIKSQTLGGKSNTMSNVMEGVREELLKDIQAKAHAVKADAVIGIRFTTSEVIGRAVELMVYGTAVRIADGDCPRSMPN